MLAMLLASCALAAGQPTARAVDLTPPGEPARVEAAGPAYASLDNVPYGMLGSWFDPATSGQGFDLQTYPDAVHGNAAVLYWYTFDPAGNQKVWLLALGTIAGNTAHLQITEPSQYQDFDRPAPPGTQYDAVGAIDFELVDCSHAHVTWRFERTLASGLGAANDGQADLQRLTPVVSVLGKDLCSTPLSAFGMSGSGADALEQCVASYTGLLGQFQHLDDNYGRCIDTVAADENAIDDLEREVAGLHADIDGAYDDGYDAGESRGYDEGYGDGYSAGYDEGYNDGYGDGYSDGYDEGSSRDDGSGIAMGKPRSAASTRPVSARPKTSGTTPSRTGRDASAALRRAQQTLQEIERRLEALKKRRAG